MGYDITYHPISESEMHEWYLDLDFEKIEGGDHSDILSIARSQNIDDFHANKYVDTVRETSKSDSNSAFDLTHGYALAIIQGLFGKYYYNRGSSFSFLIAEKPEYEKYTKPWQDILSKEYTDKISNAIAENHSSGIFISADGVIDLLSDYEVDVKVREDLEGFYTLNLPIFLQALKIAKCSKMGLLEAAGVIEVNSIDVDSSLSNSNFYNCDRDGFLVYSELVAKEVVGEAAVRDGEDSIEVVDRSSVFQEEVDDESEIEYEEVKTTRRGFFKKLLGQ